MSRTCRMPPDCRDPDFRENANMIQPRMFDMQRHRTRLGTTHHYLPDSVDARDTNVRLMSRIPSPSNGRNLIGTRSITPAPTEKHLIVDAVYLFYGAVCTSSPCTLWDLYIVQD